MFMKLCRNFATIHNCQKIYENLIVNFRRFANCFPIFTKNKCPIHFFIRLSSHLGLEILDHHNDLLHRRHIHRICSVSSGKEEEKRQHCRKIKRKPGCSSQVPINVREIPIVDGQGRGVAQVIALLLFCLAMRVAAQPEI